MNVLNNMSASNVSLKYQLLGPTLSPSTACATGTSAIAESMHLIRDGIVDVMMVGGTEEIINPVILEACIKMGAMSRPEGKRDPEELSRPFDKSRNGFVLGEGSGVLIIEVHRL